MKKLSFLLLFTFFLALVGVAQNAPRGMKYQAVARDLKGEVLANAKIELRINLLSKKDGNQVSHYSEVHTVVTNQLGLFTLVVGEGKTESGNFDAVPWSEADIWMEIQIKANGQSDFTSISNSQLLAVPYAYYAATAGVLAGTILHDNIANKEGDNPACPCEEGLSQIKVLYLGPAPVTIKVYKDKNLHDLITTFTGVNNGAILTVNATVPDGKLKDNTYFQVVSPGIDVAEIPTKCEGPAPPPPGESALGETFGNFSMLSHLDKKNHAECTVCNIQMDWKVGGNALMDMCNWLGTKSYTDLVLITNNIERLRITKDGNININNNLQIGNNLTINNNLDIGNDLTVKRNVLLNANVPAGGSTINYGPFTVANMSPTNLSGILNVDKDSWLKTKLRVDGITDLNSALNVNNLSATTLTGTLRVDKLATFKQQVLIDNPALGSTSPLTGALVVAGGVGIGQNLNVGGVANFGGGSSFNGIVNIPNLTQSTATTNGALIVAGGVGIGKNLNVGGVANFGGGSSFSGIVNIPNLTQSTSTTDGALIVAGGVGVGKNLNVGGTLNVIGTTTINNSFSVIKSDPAFISSIINMNGTTGDGLLIKLGKTHPAWTGSAYANITNLGAEMFQSPINTIRGWIIDHNDFNPNQLITLFPSSLIAGSACNLLNIVIDKLNSAIPLPFNFPDTHISNSVTLFGGLDLGLLGSIPSLTVPAINIPGFQLIPAIPNINCGNLPSFTVPNIAFTNVSNSLTNANQFISFVDKDDRELGSVRAQSVLDWSANYLDGSYFVHLMAGLVGIDLLNGIANAVSGFTDISKSYNSIGVEYASGHGDYAEWLERSNPGELISAGDIVGVKGGKVSKNLEGAEQILAVSHNPIVLGNAPSKDKEPYGNKIAFTGQVPVKVVGAVTMGDYIIAKGDISGYGVAVSPASLTTADLKFAVGRSWETNLNEGPKMVNTLIGIDNGDYIKIMKDSQDKITAMELRMKTMEEKMDKILGGKEKKAAKK